MSIVLLVLFLVSLFLWFVSLLPGVGARWPYGGWLAFFSVLFLALLTVSALRHPGW